MIFNRKSGRVPEGNLVNSHFRNLTSQLKMVRSRGSDRARSSLALQNVADNLPEVLEKERRDLENFLIEKKSRIEKFLVIWRLLKSP